MADLSVTSAELRDGVLTVSGSGFTQTTTQLFVDGAKTQFSLNAEGQLEADVDSASEVYALKGEVESEHVAVDRVAADPQTGSTGSGESPSPTTTPAAESPSAAPSDQGPSTSGEAGSGEPFDPGGDVHEEGYKTAEDNVTPGDLVEDDLKTRADVSTEQLATAGTAGAAAKQQIPEPDRTPLAEGEHLGVDFRTRVENTAVEDITKTVSPRDPYPEGNPPDSDTQYYLIHGRYPAKPEDNASPSPQAKPEGGI